MLKKLALAAALAAFAAAPVLAQPASSKPAATKTMKSKGKRTCYDLAWDSQAQKDCLAKGTESTSTPKKAMKKSKKTT